MRLFKTLCTRSVLCGSFPFATEPLGAFGAEFSSQPLQDKLFAQTLQSVTMELL